MKNKDHIIICSNLKWYNSYKLIYILFHLTSKIRYQESLIYNE